MCDDSQDISEDADSPHVGIKAYRFVVGDLGSSELGGRRRDFDDLVRVELRRQTEVNQLHVAALLLDTHHVLRLHKKHNHNVSLSLVTDKSA